MEMLAEKAALLSAHTNGNDNDEDEIPRLTSDQASSPVDERRDPALSIVTPGDSNVIDPLSAAVPVTGTGVREGMSEKARGKLRAVEPEGDGGDGGMVDVDDEELMAVANAGIGPAGYIPTQEWVSSWQKG
jgi:hypothetical protein